MVCLKLVNKPINVISVNDSTGNITPIRIRIKNDTEEDKIVKNIRIIISNIEKRNGNMMKIFRCQSVINDKEILFELKYEYNTCIWSLYKI